MASTGVTVSDGVVSQFEEVKYGRLKYQFIIYKIEDGVIVTESFSPFAENHSENFAEFIGRLPADGCRYALYDMYFTTNDDRPCNKLVSISW